MKKHFLNMVWENCGKIWTCFDCGRVWTVEEAEANRVSSGEELNIHICRGPDGRPHRSIGIADDDVVEAARILGSSKSAKKAAAVRENGKKGGRPLGPTRLNQAIIDVRTNLEHFGVGELRDLQRRLNNFLDG